MKIRHRKYISFFFILALLIGYQHKGNAYQRIDDSVILPLKNGKLKIQVCDQQIIHVLFDPSGEFKSIPSLVVKHSWRVPDFQVEEKKDQLDIITGQLIVRINLNTGAISFFNKEKQLYFKENQLSPHDFIPAEILGEATHHAYWNLEFNEKEGIYGLGQFPEGIMNYRGHSLTLTQENMTVALPFLISTKNYGLLVDNYSKIIFNDNLDSSYFWIEVADVLDYYFMAGKNMDGVIQAYREITGAAPLFGKWAYGYWQSKERYKTQEELLEVAREYRKRRIPIDNIMQDWLYWGEDPALWNAMAFDSTRYPNPEKMIRELHDSLNFHLMISIWPVIGYDTDLYREMYPAGLLFEPFHWTDGHTYDAYNPLAREIYWKHLNEKLFSLGIDAWWMDGTEPEIFVAPHERSTKSARKNYLGTMARYLNPYSLMTTEGVYQGQRSVNSSRRVFILTRSAFPGQQRNSAATWSGDIVASWETLRKQIPAGINFCMAGIPYWSNDIGGFHVYRYGAFPGGCENPGYRELYVRWFQYATFHPIFRAHGTDTPREVWQFGKPGEWAYEALVRYLDLRYRLMPYIYSLAWKVTSAGYTLMRGLPMDFATDRSVYNIGDQFMFGPSLLIAPVTEHMYYGEDYYNEAIPAECLFTEDGRQGQFNARYYNGRNLDTLMVDSLLSVTEFDVYLGRDLPPQVHWDRNSMSWSGYIRTEIDGEYELWLTSDDAVRFWWDDSLMIDFWNDKGEDRTHRIKIYLKAGEKFPFRVEQSRQAGATKLRLAWRTPRMISKRYDPDLEYGMRDVYLPKSCDWYDFWTGQKIRGGRWIEKAVPIDVMPIYVRAGSILPMGPKLQYASEKPVNPIELRIYTGANAEFILYEDEGDSYAYEQGIYATIPIQWNEKDQTLIIGERQGKFPGILKNRIFKIIWVKEEHGIGEEISSKVDEMVTYDGNRVIIRRGT